MADRFLPAIETRLFQLRPYGFLAYALVRDLPGRRERFEVAFWTAALIAAIGFSRIFLSVHYMTDVLAGFMVGAFWLLVGFAFAEWTRMHRSESSLGV